LIELVSILLEYIINDEKLFASLPEVMSSNNICVPLHNFNKSYSPVSSAINLTTKVWYQALDIRDFLDCMRDFGGYCCTKEPVPLSEDSEFLCS
jgi:hypothetical protein